MSLVPINDLTTSTIEAMLKDLENAEDAASVNADLQRTLEARRHATAEAEKHAIEMDIKERKRTVAELEEGETVYSFHSPWAPQYETGPYPAPDGTLIARADFTTTAGHWVEPWTDTVIREWAYADDEPEVKIVSDAPWANGVVDDLMDNYPDLLRKWAKIPPTNGREWDYHHGDYDDPVYRIHKKVHTVWIYHKPAK